MRPHKLQNWYQVLYQWLPRHESILFSILPQMVAAVGLSVFWTVLVKTTDASLSVPNSAHRAFGFVLGFLLVMRTSISYQRYTEGFSQLGALGKVVRNVTREVALLAVGEDDALVGRFTRYAKLFMVLVMMHLRSEVDITTPGSLVHTLVSPDELTYLATRKRRPLLVVGWMSIEVAVLKSKAFISEREYLHIMAYMESMTSEFVACTKVKAMPLPFCYAQIFFVSLCFYVFTVPMAFVEDYGWATPVVSAFVSFTMFGIWAVSVHMEEPYLDFLHVHETVPMTRILHSTILDVDAITRQITDWTYGATRHRLDAPPHPLHGSVASETHLAVPGASVTAYDNQAANASHTAAAAISGWADSLHNDEHAAIEHRSSDKVA
ncbi:uncharacterized protein AMSG_03755 [Thecamonas trahens ATCC 50062]|uniref:Uncharacterized protein n=1 Tax=Thecamonas trahens ATCC 50062 TaxID=461836 RepID=A0A0L0D4N6_THETB|nr:hypothetical protein AMSG_03755 [Thecamonas trahens ATCC 50062]KNC47322.1 hypothetical protein AMSG_03755 [Thecamonas trahens ATCC 50062]|eukprot:XP_013759660.1 hypothetical protein AMSG_03755 [Thecamonas trahens ATCC 50062]